MGLTQPRPENRVAPNPTKIENRKNNVKFGLPMVELVAIDTPYVLYDEKKFRNKKKCAFFDNFWGYAIFRPPP